MALFGLHTPIFGPLHPIIGKLAGSTGLSGFTQWRVPYGNATGGLTDSANFTFDGTGITLGSGTTGLQEIIKINNGTLVLPKVQYNSNFFGSGYAGWLWTLDTGATAMGTLSNDAEVILFGQSKALDKEVAVYLMNTTDLTDGSSWLISKRADIDNHFVIEFQNNVTSTSVQAIELSTTGGVTIPTMSTAGFVKNSAAGLLSGGNTIGVADITDIATTYLKLDTSNDPLTDALHFTSDTEYIDQEEW